MIDQLEEETHCRRCILPTSSSASHIQGQVVRIKDHFVEAGHTGVMTRVIMTNGDSESFECIRLGHWLIDLFCIL